MPVPGREERIKIMENLIEKRSIVEQVSVAQENLDEKEREQREKVREAAKTTVKASSWKEAAAAAGVTLVEAGEQTEKEEIVQKKKRFISFRLFFFFGRYHLFQSLLQLPQVSLLQLLRPPSKNLPSLLFLLPLFSIILILSSRPGTGTLTCRKVARLSLQLPLAG